MTRPSNHFSQSIILHKRKIDFIQMKQAIWLYFILLIFEGALRKWILPGLSDALLIVRDPVALFILFKAIKQNLFQTNLYIVSILVVTIIAFITTMLFGHGNLIVAIYGIRIMLLHFPLIFVIGKVFSRNDVIRMGKLMLWIALPMSILIGFQFYSPQSAWINRGLAGSLEGAGFGNVNGYSRPPGTFSFTSGNVNFWGLVSCFLLYFWLQVKQHNKTLLIAATVALFGAMSFSISRTLFFEIGLSVVFALIASWLKPIYFVRLLFSIFIVLVVVVLLSQLSLFHTGIDTFIARFTDASESEGGIKGTLGDRFLGGLIGAITNSGDLFWGEGMGMGTNAGAKLMTGNATFLISEGEWGRLIGESGIILGISTILIRVFLSISLIRKGFQKMIAGDSLAWLLLSFGFVNLVQGPLAQPTVLGFSVLTGGLIMAALKVPSRKLHKRFYNRQAKC